MSTVDGAVSQYNGLPYLERDTDLRGGSHQAAYQVKAKVVKKAEERVGGDSIPTGGPLRDDPAVRGGIKGNIAPIS